MADIQSTIDPFFIRLTMIVRPDKSPQEAITVVDKEIAQLQETPVQIDEMNKAIKQAKAMFAYGSENITNQAFWLGYAEMFAAYDGLNSMFPKWNK